MSTTSPAAVALITEHSRLIHENNALRTAVDLLSLGLEAAIGRFSEADPGTSKILRDFMEHAHGILPPHQTPRAIENLAAEALSVRDQGEG